MTRLSVLLLEDDEDWRAEITRDCQKLNWSVVAVDTVSDAVAIIQSGDIVFDILIADKGGSNSLRGKIDSIGHRDGLEVIRLMKKEQPHCIRILSTGEKWSRRIFEDESLALDIFMDKGWYSENRAGMFDALVNWTHTNESKGVVVFDSETPSRREL